MAIKRIWHGWTSRENAEAYRRLLNQEILPGIEAKNMPGYRGIELLQRDRGEEVEFVTIMSFGSLHDVVAFQGEDYERCYVPDSAQAVLSRWDLTCAHFEIVESRQYQPAVEC